MRHARRVFSFLGVCVCVSFGAIHKSSLIIVHWLWCSDVYFLTLKGQQLLYHFSPMFLYHMPMIMLESIFLLLMTVKKLRTILIFYVLKWDYYCQCTSLRLWKRTIVCEFDVKISFFSFADWEWFGTRYNWCFAYLSRLSWKRVGYCFFSC